MLNQGFFQEELPRLLAAYRAEKGDEKAQPELVLKNGITIRVEGAVEGHLDYITFDYKLRDDRRRAVVPYTSIVAVTFGPSERERAKPGLI